MRRLATVVCVAMASTGGACAAREARPPVSSAARVASPSDSLLAEPAGGRGAALDRPSRGSAAFGNFVRAHEPQLQFCYREARAASPNLVGSATVTVALAADGSVRSADILRRSWSGRGSQVVEACMLSRVRAWRFPPVNEKDEHVHSFAVIFSK